ncbi:unnamed protein product [Symbiodinium sp. CCMP2592]|nr:unnamed protein product [Symbiodinium sp. CCMP2592]CAE7452943.1 unnamed protein product [Symbiodinium sp. CCMP2592]
MHFSPSVTLPYHRLTCLKSGGGLDLFKRARALPTSRVPLTLGVPAPNAAKPITHVGASFSVELHMVLLLLQACRVSAWEGLFDQTRAASVDWQTHRHELQVARETLLPSRSHRRISQTWEVPREDVAPLYLEAANLRGRSFCELINNLLDDPDGLLIAHIHAILVARGTNRTSLNILGCPGSSKTFSLLLAIMCIDAVLDFPVVWTSQQHAALIAVLMISHNVLADAPLWLRRRMVVRRVSGKQELSSTVHDHVPLAHGAGQKGPTPGGLLESFLEARGVPMEEDPPGAQQLGRYSSEVHTALVRCRALIIDEGQQEGHAESVNVTEAAEEATSRLVHSTQLGPLRVSAVSCIWDAVQGDVQNDSQDSSAEIELRPEWARWLFLTPTPPVRGCLLRDAPEAGGCDVQLGDRCCWIPYAALLRVRGRPCFSWQGLTEGDIAAAIAPAEHLGPSGTLTYMANLAAMGARLKMAKNTYQAEGLEAINGVAFNLGLVSSARLLTEVYLFITSVRYPQAVQWTLDDLRDLLLAVLTHLYITQGHRVRAVGGQRLVLVNPSNRLLHNFQTFVGLSNAGLTDENDELHSSDRIQGKLLEDWVSEQDPHMPRPAGITNAQQAGIVLRFFGRHHAELGPFIDLYSATACAGSTGSVHLCIVDRTGDFTESGEAAHQRLTAALTRGTGPLLVVSPAHTDP